MNKRQTTNSMIIVLAMIFVGTFSVYALPEGERVISGDVEVKVENGQVTYNVNSSKAIINFDKFNVDTNEQVVFNGPNSEVLARITGGERSYIDGTINSNLLMLALINTAGIHLGPNATLTARNLVLSTRDITDSNFINGEYLFDRLSEIDKGYILNEGQINIIDGGFGVLIAGAIENRGIVIALAGKIVLAAGDAIKLDISSGGLISVAITEETAAEITDYTGKSILDQIKNSGTLEANGGNVVLKAESLTDIFRNSINLEGIIVANRIEFDENGIVSLVASGDIVLNADMEAYKIDVTTDKGIKSYGKVKARAGGVWMHADKDGDGEGELKQFSGLIEAEGDIHLDASGEMTIYDVKTESGSIIIGAERAPAIVTGPANGIEAGYIEMTALKFNVISMADVTRIVKPEGDIDVEALIDLLAENLVALDLGDSGRVTYIRSKNITLETPRGDINTSPGVFIPGNQVKLSAQHFGSNSNPVGINADLTYINRIQGNIDISEMWGLGSTITIRGPAPNAGDSSSWGAVTYQKSSELVLNAAKTTLSGADSSYIYGDITFHNFELLTPDKEIYFEPGKTYTFKGSLNIVGSPNVGVEEYYIKMHSQEEGEAWHLNVQTDDFLLERVNISDCYSKSFLFIPIGADSGGNFNLEIDPMWIGNVADNLWSTLGNWDGTKLPSQNAPVTFGTSDLVTYPNANKDCTMDDAGTWNGNLTITSDYTGTITVALPASSTLTMDTVSMAGGAFTVTTSNLTMEITQEFTLSGGTFTLSDTTVNHAKTLTVSGGTYNGNTGTVSVVTTFSATNGTFNAPTTLNIDDNFSVSNPSSFVHGNNTVQFNATNN
ncbi:MAG: filamentous hemagglutinin N-terminal domain-containing protein, partial [Candidatus Omnitrophica bacterium]|nr:filamentous hemagglutinin N-terminal domain-containing protein [Candidatus Omnitrophota bacterium]